MRDVARSCPCLQGQLTSLVDGKVEVYRWAGGLFLRLALLLMNLYQSGCIQVLRLNLVNAVL